MKKHIKIWQKTRAMLRDKQHIPHLFARVSLAIGKYSKHTEKWKLFEEKLNTLLRMGKAHWQGEYRAFSNRSLFFLIFALLYFVTPTDSIPDFIPTLGFADDISIIYFVFNRIDKDIKRFITWEKELTAPQ